MPVHNAGFSKTSEIFEVDLVTYMNIKKYTKR